MQLKLTDLLWFTVYFAIGAWLFTLGARLSLLIWVGMVFGFLIGSRSDYPTILLTICGGVFGLTVLVGVLLIKIRMSPGAAPVSNTVWIVVLGIVWSMAAAIFIWLITRLRTNLRFAAKTESPRSTQSTLQE